MKESFRLAGTQLKYSNSFHPQTNGQTEVLNRCLETYLRCFASGHPRTWSKFWCWAEFWFNTTFHTSLKTSPFVVVYGRDPPALLPFEEGSTKNFELDKSLKLRDAVLVQLKGYLLRGQQLMKSQADKHRRDPSFAVNDMVYFKLKPYRQSSVAHRFCQKLAAKFYGPYQILECICRVAYRVKLPVESKIHDVFHVSQLKGAVGEKVEVIAVPPAYSTETEAPLQLLDVLAKRYDAKGEMELLVTWKGKQSSKDSWMLLKDFMACFPSYEFEGKLGFEGRGIDRYRRTYFCKK